MKEVAPVGGAAPGLTRLLELLPAARPAEAAAVLATLGDAELAAAIAAAAVPTSRAVSDFVVTSGGPASAAALARRAFADQIDDRVDDLLRRLAHKDDPVLDVVLREEAEAYPTHDWLLPLLDRPRSGDDAGPGHAVGSGPMGGAGPVADAGLSTASSGPSSSPSSDDTPVSLDQLQKQALDGLARGTLRPEELLSRPPALTAVVLAAPLAPTAPRHPARAGRAALRAELAALLADRLGAEPAAWSAVIGRVDTWPGSLTGLLADVTNVTDVAAGTPSAPGETHPPDSERRTADPASNVLLAAAPPDVAAVCLADRLSPSLIRRMVRRGPLCRPLFEHVLGPDLHPSNADLPRLLAENELTPDSVLVRLMELRPDDEPMLTTILTREFASAPVRMLAVRRREALTGHPYERLANLPRRALAALLEAADDPAWLNASLRRIGPGIPEPVRLRGYAALARLAGAEAVWAAELEVAGRLDQAAEAVRASMAEGTDAPLLAAAREEAEKERVWTRFIEDRGSAGAVDSTVRLRSEESLDDPLAWPREDLVRTVLEGRPERWRALTDFLRAGASEPWEQLVPLSALDTPEKEAV